MGHMLDYIKNSTRFKSVIKLLEIQMLYKEEKKILVTQDEIFKAMKKAFRYAQDKAKDQWRDFIIKKERKKMMD